MVCSGSWDCTISLWQTADFDKEGDLVSVKKRKLKDQGDLVSVAAVILQPGEPVSTLVGHTQCVSSVVWPQRESIYSASWDHSVRKWDAETGKDLSHIFCGKVLNCLDIGEESSALIAAGASDPVLRIWALLLQKVMLWDLRTAVLCADWWKGDSVISGGADSNLCISSEIPVVR
ncbi:hypothetical protein L6164_006729 [Bauhinia variegata]|uniref:Uncharacterized protein n=1 Tax=Bauhinia variegata TaxID=167791 RepID=A0ACB9PWT9_BAUVA|nr:hypothetical protein L6164_006729 [Bauhinia variegata]